MKNDTIILIGMPGAGKSTIGVVLAKVMGLEFVDSDLIIQKRENRLLQRIIEEDGLEAFIQIENEVNASIELSNSVVATGGSVIYGEKAMNHLRDIGTVVYIKLSCETLVQRLGNIEQRGVALKENQSLQSLYDERCPLYEKYADVTIDAENLTIQKTMEKIKESLENRGFGKHYN